ncbi:alpha/beta hydrolase [Conexibacter arvalis]|uniref:Triacylglycerol lipase/alpha-L-fucosidase 2 n=1 Tax=Conexibacter arvalis TaxID=912552 RepID=A0A840I8V2_9ACTN|nr:alpha/beta hydrolase [Conexibacter arvalis]MBB4660701.1 triacylglycerol lipase/alpha-L-fucosidase 2 [Conexibacter arvalis]
MRIVLLVATLLGAFTTPAASTPPAAAAVVAERYGPRPLQTVDVHRPPTARARAGLPAVLLVHGGGWFSGDKRKMAPIAETLAAAGFVVFNVNYTLATPYRPGLPVQRRDLRRALDWVAHEAPRFGADPRRIGALGSSAGGNLAALLATGAWAPAQRLRALATWSAPLDLARLPHGQLRGLAARFTGCPRLVCRARIAGASPLRHVTPWTPPTLLVNARRELVPSRQAVEMAAALDRAGVDHELLIVPGALHGRHLAPQALGATIAFLRARL